MKYISFAIPCYNSEAYMEKAINSILVGGEDVEIIVVNRRTISGKISDDCKSSREAKWWTRRCSELWTGACDRKVF